MAIRTVAQHVRISKVLCCLSVLFGLPGCQVDPRPGSNYTTSGQNLGNVPLRTISPAESRITVAGGDPLIKQYEARKLSDRRQEQITLEGGIITVSFMDPGIYMNSNVTPRSISNGHRIKSVLHGEKKIPMTEEMIKKLEYQNGELFYASGRSNDEVCFVFNSVFWKRNQVDPLGQGIPMFEGVFAFRPLTLRARIWNSTCLIC
jgi:hypothetical protein